MSKLKEAISLVIEHMKVGSSKEVAMYLSSVETGVELETIRESLEYQVQAEKDIRSEFLERNERPILDL